MLAIAVGLAALAWSCESEQTGYDVTVPLIGPIEFDETSCEVSGDLCSTNNDCFDEDGFDVGPCTETLKALEPITYEVSLSPSNPSYTLPALADTAGWASLLAALENPDDNPIAFTTENFSVTGGPVTLSVRPFSRNGLYFGRDAGYDPNAPGTPSIQSCTFDLEDSSTGQDYTEGIITCLRDWITEHGAPLEFDIEVTSSAGAAAKSGFSLKQDPPPSNFSVTGGDNWDTNQECPGQTDTEVLEAAGEGSDFFDLLTCSGLTLTGNGSTSEPIMIYGLATIYDPCGKTATARLGNSNKDKYPLGKGDYSVTVAKEGDTIEVTGDAVPVVFSPDEKQFLDYFFTAAAGECVSGDDPPIDPGTGMPATGYASVTWEHCYDGDEDPVPTRTGKLTFEATGFCPVAGDSGGAGATGGSGP